jgi:hypothetical protein
LTHGEHYKALFKTTSYVVGSQIKRDHLNVINLPTQEKKARSLAPIIREGSAPPVSRFAAEFYDYALAQKLLVQICEAPAEVIRDLCATDLSRGPYLFTYVHPASTLSPMPPPYLVLDLSGVHIRAFDEFITAYKEQVMRSNYADRERIDTLRLRVLNITLTAADWIAPTMSTITDIVRMAKAGGSSKD